jgi:hypothetical protein
MWVCCKRETTGTARNKHANVKGDIGVGAMTNGKWFIQQFRKWSMRWLPKNRFRLLFFFGLLASQALLLYVFGGLLYWHFFNQRPVLFAVLVLIFGLETAFMIWFLRDVRMAVRLWVSVPSSIVMLLASVGVCWLSLIIVGLSQTILLDSDTLGQRRFYLTAGAEIYKDAYYVVNDCDFWGRNCLISERIPFGLWSDFFSNSYPPATLFISASSGSVGILEGNTVVFKYPLPQSYP